MAARLDIVDRSFAVLMRGTAISDVAPVATTKLESELIAEIEPALGHLDAKSAPVICGLLGDDYAWRVTSIGDSECFGLVLEPSDIGSRASEFARSRALGAADAQLLRLTVGGYSVEETSRRLHLSARRVATERMNLARKMGFSSLAAFVTAVATAPGNATAPRIAATA